MAPIIEKRAQSPKSPPPQSPHHATRTSNCEHGEMQLHTHSHHSHGHSHGHDHTNRSTNSNNNNNNYKISKNSKNSQSQSHSHAKENSVSSKHSKRGLEILDFHESWLEEMEIYKDRMYLKKQSEQMAQAQLQAHLLAAHAHLHGYPIDSGYYSSSGGGGSSVHLLDEGRRRLAGGEQPESSKSHIGGSGGKVHAIIQHSMKPLSGSDGQNLTARAMAMAIEARSAQNVGNVQLLLKRPREEIAASIAASAAAGKNSKRRSINSQTKSGGGGGGGGGNSSSGATTPRSNSSSSSGIDTAGSSSGSGSGSKAPSAKPSGKIIVNQFHASSMLNAQHREEKTKLLTQNGLTKSAASAYETSLYASHYLPQENRGVLSTFNGARHHSGEHTPYVGVALAKNVAEGGERTKRSDDDPCAGNTQSASFRISTATKSTSTSRDHCSRSTASPSPSPSPRKAIDDITAYSDSDSEEDYVGQPFYLPDDLLDTQQSLHIRYKREPVDVSSESDDCEEEHEVENDSQPQYFQPKSILTPSLFPNVPPYLNFSSHVDKGPAMPPALHKVLKWKLSPVMPKIVKRVVLNSGFRIIKNTTDWMAIWEKHMKSPGFRTIRSHQKYNHMPGSFRIGRKDSMWRSILCNMKRFGAKDFGFMQKSYVMPDDLESLRLVWPKNASRLTKWIVKPPASARGTGIRIVNKWSQFPKDRPLVVQKYIEHPLLINDNKFDMRIYVVVTSINPLRIYMHKDGLARFASVKYSSELNSLDDRCMHLTNYSINKFSQNYAKNEDFNACQGHKWTLQSLWSCLEARGINTKRLWATLRNLVIKAIISGESGLNRMYRQNVNFRYNCFELFGFDVLLDENLIPWLLEINISPSLHSDMPLDLHVKGPLVQAVLNTALYQVPPKLTDKQQSEILEELRLQGPLCHDKRIFTTCLTTEEVRKHNHFTNRAIEFREEYLETILDDMLPDDIRSLIIAEDEYARCQPLERIFPTADTHIYLKFIDNPRYYNRLLDAWEHRFANCRERGIAVLRRFCHEGYHLQVSEEAMEKEPNVTLTEIDMLHVKKSDDTLIATIDNVGDSANATKECTPDSNLDSVGAIDMLPCAKVVEPIENDSKPNNPLTSASAMTVK